jgi:hypothetical protein
LSFAVRKFFEIKEQMRIFKCKREEATGIWSNLLNEQLHNLYPSPNQGKLNLRDVLACMVEMKDALVANSWSTLF